MLDCGLLVDAQTLVVMNLVSRRDLQRFVTECRAWIYMLGLIVAWRCCGFLHSRVCQHQDLVLE